MTEPRSPIRALVASFLFTDLVGFSKGTVAEQYAAKSALSAILRDNLAALQDADYRVKDTGDGALIIFLASPEHALYMALAITQDFARVSPTPEVASKSLRTGLNIGPVKEQMDLEARPNYIGDGINDAKRIMDFAAPGQIAASRSFYESVSCLDAMYAQLFSHLGAPDDKHGRAHELYGVKSDPAVLEKLKLDLALSAPEPASVRVDAPRSNGLAMKSGTAVDVATTAASNEAAAAVPKPGGPRAAPTRFAARTSLGIVAAAVTIGIGVFVLNAWRADSVAPKETVRANETAGQARSAPGSVASSAPGDGASSTPPALPTPSSPPPEVANTVRATKGASDGNTPQSPPPVAALPTAAGTSPSVKPSVPASPATRPPTSTAVGDQVAERCRRIIEKAELGEPLSPDEKKELANSCR